MRKRAIVARLLWAQGVNGVGDGLWFSIWAIFFTKIQGIAPAQMGLAIGLGGVVGLISATPAGILADRHGPREVLGAIITLRGLVMVAYVFVADFWTLLLVTTLFAAVQSSGVGVRVTLVYGLMPREEQLRVLAQSRVVAHITYAIGAGAAAFVLSIGTEAIFVAAVLLNAGTFLATAVITLMVPSVPAVPAERRKAGTQGFRDVPYVVIMVLTSSLALCWAILSTGLPLWIADDTVAPLWTIALAVVISSAAIALFQVRVARERTQIRGAVRSARVSAVALATCCGVFALAAVPDVPALAVAVVALGVAAHVVGELNYVPAQWGISLELMVRDAQGQYQGVAASTEAVMVALGSTIVSALVTGLGGVGWLLLGAILFAATVPLGALSRIAMRSGDRVANHTNDNADTVAA